MRKLVPYLSSASFGFLLAGALLRLMQPQRDRIWASFLIVGLVLGVVYLVQSWRELVVFFGRRSAREGANTALLIAIVVGIVVAINYLANRHAEQWDFTAAQQHSLSPQTVKILAELDRDVTIILFEDPSSPNAIVTGELLQLYEDAGSRVRTEIIDPEAEPGRVAPYQAPTEPAIPRGTIMVDTGDSRERATAPSEPEITNALIRALDPSRKRIYFTGGHQEKDLSDTEDATGLSNIKSRLEESTYETETLFIARSVVDDSVRIPDDAAAVVVAGPRTDFLPEEIEALDRYIRKGGKAVFLVDPENQGTVPALRDYLAEIGVLLEDNVVIDPLSSNPYAPLVGNYGRHPIVESFGNAMSVFPLVRTVARAEDAVDGEIRELFSTRDNLTWAETDLEGAEARGGPGPDQKRGPLPLAFAVTLETEAPEEGEGEGEEPIETESARLVIVGDSDFIRNDLVQSPLLNADLFLNMVNWVTRDEGLIAIRPREPEDRRVFLTQQQMTNVFLLSFLILPGIVFVTGLSVWWGRR